MKSESDEDITLRSVMDLVKEYELRAKKSFGQNFLIDPQMTAKIVRELDFGEQDVIFEIGPGPATLTRHLLASPAKRVVVIEKDTQFMSLLEAFGQKYPGRLVICHQDALKIDWEVFIKIHADAASGKVKLISNLPYNISTPILTALLEKAHLFACLVLMFQKEVAERISAAPDGKEFGRLSVIAQWLMSIEHAFDVPPQVFYPPPKITSSVVKMTPREFVYAEGVDPQLFHMVEKVTQAAFGQRRKMLRSSLKALSLKDLEQMSRQVNIDLSKRAENLQVKDFINIANYILGRG